MGPPHARPYLTVDVVVVGQGERGRSVLLVQRAHPPFQERWALPGGFVEEWETTRRAAARELREETGLALTDLQLLGVYDEPGRDPRGWNVSVVFTAVVPGEPTVRGGDDARAARFWPAAELPPLAFDHDQIIADALARLD